MSKSKTIIASLGVVAGLGVAMLTLASYASETVSGNVDVMVEVLPAIAMTIVGNNDGNTVVNSGTHGAIDVFNPAEAASSSIDGHTTPATATTTTSSSAWQILPNAVKEGGAFKSTVTVYTNSVSGYTLTVKDSDTTTDLTGTMTDTIPATSATTLTAGTAAWGYRVGTTGDWLAMPASTATAASIGSEDVKTSNGTEYVVEYGVATAADQETGIYSDTIIYTATTK